MSLSPEYDVCLLPLSVGTHTTKHTERQNGCPFLQKRHQSHIQIARPCAVAFDPLLIGMLLSASLVNEAVYPQSRSLLTEADMA